MRDPGLSKITGNELTNRLSGFCKTAGAIEEMINTLKALVTYLNCNLSLCPGAHANADLQRCFKTIGPRSAGSQCFKMIRLRSAGFVVNPIKAVPIPHSGPQSSTPAWRMTVGPSTLGIKILLLFASRPLLVSDLGCRLFRVRARGIFLLLAFSPSLTDSHLSASGNIQNKIMNMYKSFCMIDS
ncbi:uncharacterized protein LOC125137434 [Phacochoerus africanus]|uniref:uncharacterized protein LOC125137434 n=1 Tax=Phacochoerus africanus TaxID=41426 RepID=UPI001FD9A10B|nr:uncharacterized protein LOC125137434 [Phacochoerus africanus]